MFFAVFVERRINSLERLGGKSECHLKAEGFSRVKKGLNVEISFVKWNIRKVCCLKCDEVAGGYIALNRYDLTIELFVLDYFN